MGVSQERLTSTKSIKNNTVQLLRSSRGLSGKINCAEVSSFIYDIIVGNQKDDARKLLSSSLKVRKFLLNNNLGRFVNALRKYITGELIDNFIEQLIEKYITEEQRKAFIQEVCEVVLDPLPPLEIAQRFSQLLNKKHTTEKSEEQQVKEVQLTTEGQQVTEVPQITRDQQTTGRQQIKEEQQVTEIPQVTQGQQVKVEVQKTTERQRVAAEQDNLDEEGFFVAKGKDEKGDIPLDEGSGYVDIAGYFTEKGQQVTEVAHTTERQRVTTERQHKLQEDNELQKCLRSQRDNRLREDSKLQQKFHKLQRDSRLRRIIVIHLCTMLLSKVI